MVYASVGWGRGSVSNHERGKMRKKRLEKRENRVSLDITLVFNSYFKIV